VSRKISPFSRLISCKVENDKRGIKNCKSYGKVNFLVYRGKKDEKYY